MGRYESLPVSVLETYKKVDEIMIHRMYEAELQDFGRQLIVLDDDPTGIQTVHGIPVYTEWSLESLKAGFEELENMFFILTNSRSFTEKETQEVHRLLAERTAMVSEEAGKKFLMVSRGDSTLRGHYPLELEVLKNTFEENGMTGFSGQIFCPYFREGGRYTINSVHYVKEGEWLVPAGQTEFSKDKTFGYHASHLGEYIEEKSEGCYQKEDCAYITIEMLRGQAFSEITKILMETHDFQPVIVDAISECDVESFAICLLRAIKAGKEFLIRSAAAVPKVLGNVAGRPLLNKEELLGEEGNAGYGGIVLIGSHVKKTTIQLEVLKTSKKSLSFFEFDINACQKEGGLLKTAERIIREAEAAMEKGKTAVIYTSRTLLAPNDFTREELLLLSVSISNAVTSIIGGLHKKPGFLIAKGGITSSDVGTKALKVKKAIVLGQVQPGIPVWKTGEESKFPGLSYIIFPGNVGEADTLKKIVELLS